MRRCAQRLLRWLVALLLITGLTFEALLTTWKRWLIPSLARHGKHRIRSWLACYAMSPNGLKQAVADLVRFAAAQAIAQQTAGTDEHQTVDQTLGAGAGDGAIHQEQVALMCVGQVPGNRGGIAGGAGNQGIERGAPGVHRGGNQVDVFDRRLGAGHGSDPHAATAGLRPSFTAMS